MKILPQQQSLLLLFSILLVGINADEEADYMSKLLKALTPTPTGWSHNVSYCNWNGVVCRSRRVVSISLPSTSLSGILPPDLSSLPNLIHLDLHNNSLTGAVPDMFGVSTLQTMNLGHNNFNLIPDGWFGDLQYNVDLQTLNLSNNLNLLRWLFPTELKEFSLLHTLDFEATNIIGTLPSNMFDMFPNLNTVFLSYNNISGTLPPSLGNSKVRYLRLNDQGKWGRFTGKIEVISSMKFLSQAWLHNNLFSGPIPNMSNCAYLFDLQLHSNSLTGLIPPSLFALSTLKNISLNNNLLQGPIPIFHKGVKATWKNNNFCRTVVGPCDPLTTIFLDILADFGFPFVLLLNNSNGDCIAGMYTTCQGGNVVGIDFGNMKFGGFISPAFSKLKSLVNLTIGGNNLTGSIPHSLTTLPQLQLLDVSDNNLSGQIPNFSSKVRLITRGNPLLERNDGGENVTASHHGGSSKTTLRPIWIAGATIFSVGIVIFIVIIICKCKKYHILVKGWIFKKTIKSPDDNVEDFIQSYNLSVAKQYRYVEVKRMTNSFRDKLGQGGYGVVYKARLPDGRQVAVKVINESKGNGEEFINEVASISRTSHVNIVSLLGFCYENKRALIYEFMSNGSLDKFIHKSGFPDVTCNLDWNTLYQIAIGIARGLEYLHQGCISRILHLDIKPQNILLDEDFCPKISDFGLAKICQRKDSIVSILGTRGTIGFIAPEVFSRSFGGVSHKSDVYSYGMLILEMIGGRKNYDTGGSCSTAEMHFTDWIYKDLELISNKHAKDLELISNKHADDLINPEEENDMVRKIIMISLWCIQTNPSDRPSMSKVIEMLQGPLESVPYPPKPLLYSPERPPLQTSYLSSSNLLETNSISLPKNNSIKSN